MRDLSGFSGNGYDKGRSAALQALWVMVDRAVFRRVWCPGRLRVSILRWFGAHVESGVIIRHDVQIQWPWKLAIGANSWLGADSWIINLEPVTIGSNTCISQSVMLCTGSHDAASPTFEFDNAPIRVGSGVWIGARATVLRGVTIGDDALIGACALVVKDVAPSARVLAPTASSAREAG